MAVWRALLSPRHVKQAAQRLQQAVFDAHDDADDEDDVGHHVHGVEHGARTRYRAADAVVAAEQLRHHGDFQPGADGDDERGQDLSQDVRQVKRLEAAGERHAVAGEHLGKRRRQGGDAHLCGGENEWQGGDDHGEDDAGAAHVVPKDGEHNPDDGRRAEQGGDDRAGEQGEGAAAAGDEAGADAESEGEADTDGGALEREQDVLPFGGVGEDVCGTGEDGFRRGDEHRPQSRMAVLPQRDGGEERGERGEDAPKVVADAPGKRAAQWFAVFENHGRSSPEQCRRP